MSEKSCESNSCGLGRIRQFNVLFVKRTSTPVDTLGHRKFSIFKVNFNSGFDREFDTLELKVFL